MYTWVANEGFWWMVNKHQILVAQIHVQANNSYQQVFQGGNQMLCETVTPIRKSWVLGMCKCGWIFILILAMRSWSNNTSNTPGGGNQIKELCRSLWYQYPSVSLYPPSKPCPGWNHPSGLEVSVVELEQDLIHDSKGEEWCKVSLLKGIKIDMIFLDTRPSP